MSQIPKVVIKKRRARPFFARHPWVLANSIEKVEGSVEPGDEVSVESVEGKFIARGLWNPNSMIRVRLYRWDDAPLDEPFWKQRLSTAVGLRNNHLHLDGPRTAARIVYSEADGLSGLIVDRYDRWLVVQFQSKALLTRRDLLIRLINEVHQSEGALVRIDRSMAKQEGLEPVEDLLVGSIPEEPIPIVENGLTFLVDLHAGQKTGFYLDQRDNRRRVCSYTENKIVLDLFCYSGGFGLTALSLGKAASVLGVDSSAGAIALAQRNAFANGLTKARFQASEVSETLADLRSSQATFDLVICDPPKFARHPKAVEDALRGYLNLNLAALDVLAKDGILVTCSCSGHIDRELFTDVLGQAAERSGRPIQILEQLGQAPDHPVSASCVETNYLKCFICRVE